MPIRAGRDNKLPWRRELPLDNPWVKLFDFSSSVSYLAHLFEDSHCEQFHPFVFDWYAPRHSDIYLEGAEYSLVWFQYLRRRVWSAVSEARQLPEDYHLRRECLKRVHILSESIGDDGDIRYAFYCKNFPLCTKRVRKAIKRVESQCGPMLRDLAGELAVDICDINLKDIPDELASSISSVAKAQLITDVLAGLIESADRARSEPLKLAGPPKNKTKRPEIFTRRLPPAEVVECAKYLRDQYRLMKDGKRAKASRREMIAEHIGCDDTGFLERQLQPSRYGYLLEMANSLPSSGKELGE